MNKDLVSSKRKTVEILVAIFHPTDTYFLENTSHNRNYKTIIKLVFFKHILGGFVVTDADKHVCFFSSMYL